MMAIETQPKIGFSTHIRVSPFFNATRRWPIILDDKTVGDVTSAINSPRMETNLALPILSVDAAELGQELMVETVDGPVTGTVSPLPFHQRMQTAPA